MTAADHNDTLHVCSMSGDMRVLEDLGLTFLISLMYNSMKQQLWWALQLLQLYIKSKNKILALTH